MELLTERLKLRPFQPGDVGDVQRYGVQPAFYRFLPIPAQTRDSVAAFVADRIAEAQQGHDRYFHPAIEHRETGRVIGAIRIGTPQGTDEIAELGYGLAPDVQGKGYATEAAIAMLRLGFSTMGLHRIWAIADVRNEPSWRLMERIGMAREGLLRENKRIRGEWRSSYVYGILDREFAANTERAAAQTTETKDDQ